MRKMRRTSKVLLVLLLCVGIMLVGAGAAEAKGGKGVTVTRIGQVLIGTFPVVYSCNVNAISRDGVLLRIETETLPECELVDFEFPF